MNDGKWRVRLQKLGGLILVIGIYQWVNAPWYNVYLNLH